MPTSQTTFGRLNSAVGCLNNRSHYSLPAHKTKLVKDYVQSTQGRLTLHILPGYAPELNPDEAVWSHMKRTGVARMPLRKGERLRDKIDAQLAAIKATPKLVRSFFRAPSVAYVTDW